MGLDIFFKKVKAQGAETKDYDDLHMLRCAQRKESIKEEVKKVEGLLNGTINEETRQKIYNILKPYIIWEFEGKGLLECDDSKLAYCVNEIIDSYARHSDMYYHKVNFLYAYFGEKLEDEMCLVTREEVEDIIDRANKVLLAHDEELSAELLPTQGGFFFGSTDYGEWYYKDVEDVLTQFTKFLEDWTDDTIAYAYFSW